MKPVFSLALLALACSQPELTMPASSFTPRLSLSPTDVVLAPRDQQVFHAETNYPEGVRMLRQPVSWKVLEADGGTITPAGLYTAPGRAGTYHVQACREDHPHVQASAVIQVR